MNDAECRRQYAIARSRLQAALDEFEKLPDWAKRVRPAASEIFVHRIEPAVTDLVRRLRELDIKLATELMDVPSTCARAEHKSLQVLRAIWERGSRPRPRSAKLPVTPEEWEQFRELERDIDWRRAANERPQTHLYYAWHVNAETAQLCVEVAAIRDALAVLDVYFPRDRSSAEERSHELALGDEQGSEARVDEATAMPSEEGMLAESHGNTPSTITTDSTAHVHGDAITRLLSIFTNGVFDERIEQAAAVISNALKVDDKLWAIDKLMPIPRSVSAKKLGTALGVSKTAVQNTTWYKRNLKGKGDELLDRRRERHQQRAKQYESDRMRDECD